MNCEELLSLAVKKQLKKKDLNSYQDCFLDIQHFLRFKTLYFSSKRIAQAGSYVLLILNARADEWNPMPNCYVAGIDDSGKIFCTPLRWRPKAYTEDNVRRLMGFTHHHYEVFEYKEGESIRLQGDLVMDIKKIFEERGQAIDYIYETELRSNVWTDDRVLWISYMRTRLAEDEEIRRIESLIATHQELVELSQGDITRRGVREVNSSIKRVEEEIRELLNKYSIKLEYTLIGHRRVLRVRDLYIKFIHAKTFQRGDFKDFIEQNERRLTLRLGHYTRAHEVKLTGVLVSVLHNEVIDAAILSPQEIEIYHPEHGKSDFYIPKPTYARFRLLGR